MVKQCRVETVTKNGGRGTEWIKNNNCYTFFLQRLETGFFDLTLVIYFLSLALWALS